MVRLMMWMMPCYPPPSTIYWPLRSCNYEEHGNKRICWWNNTLVSLQELGRCIRRSRRWGPSPLGWMIINWPLHGPLIRMIPWIWPMMMCNSLWKTTTRRPTKSSINIHPLLLYSLPSYLVHDPPSLIDSLLPLCLFVLPSSLENKNIPCRLLCGLAWVGCPPSVFCYTRFK